MADLAGRDRQQQLHPPQRAAGRHQRRSPARSRARPSSRASRSASRSWSRPTAPASWRRSCPPACAPSPPKSRRKPAPAASSCRTTASTSFFPSARRTRTARRADVVNSEIILTNVRVLAIDQAPKEKDGQNAVVGKTVTLELKPEQAETLARARQTGTLSLALRSIADVNMVENRPTIRPTSAAKAQRRSLRRCQPARRYRSDRKDARYEMQGKSADDADVHGPRPVVFGRRCAHAQSGADAGGGERLSRRARRSPPTDR